MAAVTAGVVFLFINLGLLVRDVRRNVSANIPEIHALLVNVRDAAASARDASQQAALAAQEQRAYWNKTSLETYKTMASLRLTITRADRSFNDVLVPKVAEALDSTTNLSNTAAVQLTHTMNELQPTFDSFAKAAAGAAETMNDPRIGEAIGHLAETSDHAAGAAANTEQATAHLDGAAADVQTFIHRETTPARGAWNTVRAFWMWFAGPAAQVATAAK